MLPQLGLEGIAQLQQHLDVQGRVDQPVLRERAGRPIGGGVALLEPQAEDFLDHGAQTDPLEASQPPGKLGVEDRRRDESDLGQAGQVLAGGVQYPLGVLQDSTEGGKVGAGDGVDEGAARTLAAQLHQVGPLAVAVARCPLGVHRYRARPTGEAPYELVEGRARLDDGRHTLAGSQQGDRLGDHLGG